MLRPIRDEQGRIVDFLWLYENAAMARLNGTDSEAVVGRRLLETLPSHADSPFQQLYVEVAESGEPGVLEAPFKAETMTQEKWFRLAVVPIGQDIAVLAQDTTERKNAEAALRQSEERLRLTYKAAKIGAFDSNLLTDVDIWTPELEALHGLAPGELHPKNFEWEKLVHPDDHEAIMQWVDRSCSTGEPVPGEWRVVWPNGSVHWLSGTFQGFRDESGSPARIIGIAMDITERKRMEEALRQSESSFRDLANSMPQIVWTSHPDGHVDYFNSTWFELTHVEAPAAGIINWLPAVHPDDAERVKNLRIESLASGRPFYAEVRLITRSGEARWHVARAVPVKDEQGRVIRWYGTATDIHELKQAQETLAQLKANLESKNKEMESIIGIVSHDLRAPLVNIQGFSHEIQMDCRVLDEALSKVSIAEDLERQMEKILRRKIPESLHYIQASSDAMNHLVRTLVEVSRAGLAPTKPEVIDMNELIHGVLESIKIKFKEADVEYDIIALPDCFADRTQITQVFTNLLDNAVKYLDPFRRGQICVEGTLQAGGVLYWVSDNGIGIPPEQLDKIFEPYYQLKEKASGGIGMGLATVKKLVERNEGKIWVVSEKGQYSIFYVALPAEPSQTRKS
ncbi:MAG: PAS domain-containing sensor histidine kinase [Planctomycetaceae bacterium]|nr:PAS domain-containing sensor histidine kinase [Planctomycetaceae bacterium]